MISEVIGVNQREYVSPQILYCLWHQYQLNEHLDLLQVGNKSYRWYLWCCTMEKTVTTFQQLAARPDIAADPKLQKIYMEYSGLLRELAKKELPERIIASVNQDIAALNATSNGPELGKAIRSRQTKLVKRLEKELKIIPKNYYRNLWMLLGMTAFGLPLGAAFGVSVGNIGLLSLGLPVGMAIGMAVGMNMDKKALAEGRQLDIEVRQ